MIRVVRAWTKPLAREALAGTEVFTAWELAITRELTIAKLLVAELVVAKCVVRFVAADLLTCNYTSPEAAGKRE
jgi:hypothetical protein